MEPNSTLTAAAKSVWAKTYNQIDKGQGSLPLYVHMADSAEIAGWLWDEWLSPSIANVIAEAFGGDHDQGRIFVRWAACFHDVGKASPAFAIQARVTGRGELVDSMIDRGLRFPAVTNDRALLPHSVASHLMIQRWLMEIHGWARAKATNVAVIAGGHHGVPPDITVLSRASAQTHLLGDSDTWRSVQKELVDYSAAYVGAEPCLAHWASCAVTRPIQALVTAIVIIADWIASSTDYFSGDDMRPSAERARDAWAELRLPRMWHPVDDFNSVVDEQFSARFGLPLSVHPRPVQREAFEVARTMEEPGMIIIEAPMGEGKTEAALLAAEVLAARFGLGGCAVALPTMATTDAMFNRVYHWVEQVPDARGPRAPQTTFLAHGKARLNELFQSLAKVDNLSSVGDDVATELTPAMATVHEWLSGRKKGVLANFVVGTIDQVLFAALKTKHVALRHLAFASKVVIIDEVHASDEYMLVYLCRVLRWLSAYRVPVVLLSATLTPDARRAFAEAYVQPPIREARPRVPLTERKRLGSQPVELSEPRFAELQETHGYPLISTVTRSGRADLRELAPSSRTVTVAVERIDDEDATLVALLRDRLRDGGCAAVIRNTVDRAQKVARMLREQFPETKVILVHSRFIASDRMRLESSLRAFLGPSQLLDQPGSGNEQQGRFEAHPLIIVGTQVLEQSLDIDVDLMVSDLAPMDLLLQRMGRLHRHERDNRMPALTSARFVITGVEDWGAAVPEPNRGSASIYGLYPLLKTLYELSPDGSAGERIALPGDIAPLVRATHGGNSTASGVWVEALDDAEEDWRHNIAEKEAKAQTFLLGEPIASEGSLIGWLYGNAGDVSEDSVAGQKQVRDAEDSIEVLVVQSVDGDIRTLSWLEKCGGVAVPTDWPPERYIAFAVAGSSIRLPPRLCKPWIVDQVVGRLEQNGFPGWQESPLLKGQLVLVLDESLSAEVGHGLRVQYDRCEGMVVVDD